ncbi:DnaD domain-containing protein [Virgibacillus sp. FSP13]
MNYIKELNAFYNQITFNSISGSAVALWNTLMHFNNLCGWKKEFSVAATMLQLKSGVKESSFKRARNELQEKGYIDFQSRGGNQAAIYQIISQVQNHEQCNGFVAPATGQASDCTVTDNADHNTSGNIKRDECINHGANDGMDHSVNRSTNHTVAPLIKQIQNETKQKEIVITDAIRFYQENFGVISSFISDDMLNWINDVGESLVIAAMKRALEKNKANWGYVKGILQAWVKKGITTVEQAEADEAAFRNRQRQFRGNETRGEVVPEWFVERERKQKFEELRKVAGMETVPEDEAAERAEIEMLLAKHSNKRKLKKLST